MSLLNRRASQISCCLFIFPLIPMNMRFPTPLSTCCVFDFICVSLYFGLLILICMSFLSSRCFRNLLFLINVVSKLEFLLPPSKCRVLDFMGVSLYFGLPIWICMSFLYSRCLQTSVCRTSSHEDVGSRFHHHRVVFLIS